MLDENLIDDLLNSPPQVWATKLHHATVITALVKRASLTSEEIESACAALGVGRRRIRQLLAKTGDRMTGAPPRGHQTGVHLHLDGLRERVIADAISIAGPAARQRDVNTLVLQLCEVRRLRPPSESTVRNRFNSHRGRTDLIDRLELGCDIVADLCPLALPLLGKEEEKETAWLLAMVSSEKALFVHHKLYAGKPSTAEVSQAFDQLRGMGTVSSDIGVTLSLLHLFDADFYGATGSPRAASSSRKLVGGSVIRAICGRAIGRIQLRTDGRSKLNCNFDPVPLDVARQVIARAIAQLDGAPTQNRRPRTFPWKLAPHRQPVR